MVFLACIPILAIGLCPGLAVLVHPVFKKIRRFAHQPRCVDSQR